MIVFPVLAANVEVSGRGRAYGAACVVAAVNAALALRGQVKAVLVEALPGEDAPALVDRLLRVAETEKSGSDPAVFGFSLYVWNRALLDAVAGLIRAARPQARLLAGGPEASADPSGLLATGIYDLVVAGEGERAILEIFQGAAPRGIIHGKPLDPDQAISPWQAGTLAINEEKSVVWELARGCPFRCAYCYESLGQKLVRRLSLARIKTDLAWFRSQGVRHFTILDPTFNLDRTRTRQVLETLAVDAPDGHFDFEIRAEYLDAPQADAFARLDCSLQIGLQSADPAVLAKLDRDFDPAVFKRKIELLNQRGIIFGLDLIYGLPGDSLAGFRKSLDFALDLRPNHLDVFRLAILPGTSLHQRAPNLGLSWQNQPPYLIETAPGWTAPDLAEASHLARAVDCLYSQGRAVTWFLPTCRALKLKASEVLTQASAVLPPDWPAGPIERKRLETWQEQCFSQLADLKRPDLKAAILDLIRCNAAWGRALLDNESPVINLTYHPDLAMNHEDPSHLAATGHPGHFRVKVQAGRSGQIQWKILPTTPERRPPSIPPKKH